MKLREALKLIRVSYFVDLYSRRVLCNMYSTSGGCVTCTAVVVAV